MNKRKVIFYFILLSLLHLACGNQAERNRNAEIVENYNRAINGANTNEGNLNTGENDTEVPRFSDPHLALQKGNEYLDKNRVDKAIDALKQATELDPDLALAHLQLGVAYDLKEKADRLKPQSGDSSDSKKKNSVKALENAVRVFKKFAQEDPDDDVAFFNLGRTYTKLLNDRESERAFRRAAKLKPEDGDYQTEFGAALINLAKYSQAIRALNKALEIDENNFRAEDLLKKARAGRRRVGFKAKPKTKPSAKPSESPDANPVDKPVPKPK